MLIAMTGIIHFRRFVQCSLRHCLNSWCKEESVLVQLCVITVTSQSLTYLPVLEALADKLNLEGDIKHAFFNQSFAGLAKMTSCL